jgi:hypothetical protein
MVRFRWRHQQIGRCRQALDDDLGVDAFLGAQSFTGTSRLR